MKSKTFDSIKTMYRNSVPFRGKFTVIYAIYNLGLTEGYEQGFDNRPPNNTVEDRQDKAPCEHCNAQKSMYVYHDYCGKCGLGLH